MAIENKALPKPDSYEPDDGPLTDAQMDAIRKIAPQIPDSHFTKRLFDEFKGLCKKG